MQNLYLVIIASLIIYVIFLNIQIVKKNVFIESTVKRISGIDKDVKMDELIKFLKEIKKLDYYSSFFDDKLFNDESLNYIFKDVNCSAIYIHYTKDEADAKNILSEGFRFADSFYKTALTVSNDKLDLIIKHNSRKYFGDYLILICISNKIIKKYSAEMEKAGMNNSFIENILTETAPVRNENSDLVFLLPNQFIKGYINHRTGEIFDNPAFDSEYSSPGFMDNINRKKGDQKYLVNNN
jgi:hypothetical protein